MGDTVGTYDNDTEGKLVKVKVGASGDDILETLVIDPIGASEKIPCDHWTLLKYVIKIIMS